MDDSNELAATEHAGSACEHSYRFNRVTMQESGHAPAEMAEQLAHLAALVAALPEAFSQLSTLLAHALNTQVLTMDPNNADSDPSIAIGVARLHLDEARGQAVDLHKLLDAAHRATARILSDAQLPGGR